jgi:hypothetical protein
MPYEETWVKTHCPKCKKVNWFCEGNLQDMTVPDTEAIKCWSCGHAWWRDPDTPYEMGYNEDEECSIEDYADEGQEKPR